MVCFFIVIGLYEFFVYFDTSDFWHCRLVFSPLSFNSLLHNLWHEAYWCFKGLCYCSRKCIWKEVEYRAGPGAVCDRPERWSGPPPWGWGLEPAPGPSRLQNCSGDVWGGLGAKHALVCSDRICTPSQVAVITPFCFTKHVSLTTILFF